MRIVYWIYIRLQTHTICNAYCFSTATMVVRKRLNVKLYVHDLSCLHIRSTSSLLVVECVQSTTSNTSTTCTNIIMWAGEKDIQISSKSFYNKQSKLPSKDNRSYISWYFIRTLLYPQHCEI